MVGSPDQLNPRFRALCLEAKRKASELQAAGRPLLTAELLANGHAKQLALIRDRSLYNITLCSRRAGKTYGLAAMSLLTVLSRPRQNVLYVGLSKPHARRFLWSEVWKPLLQRYGVDCKPNETDMTTVFPNGSIMYVSGTDDVRHVESLLGNRLNLAIVDEAQSQADSVLVPLTTRILPNALLDDMDNPGKLIMSGTIPEVDAGRFMDVWRENRWARHNWNRFENPHLKNQEAALEAYLVANPGLTRDSPEVQREWYGRFVFDSSATAYRYHPDLNAYGPTIPLCDLYAVGIDPGTRDRMAVVVWGWSARARDVWHVHEKVWPKNAQGTWADLASELRDIRIKFNPISWYYDAGSSQMTIDTFGHDYGIPIVQAAKKSDMPGQVARFSDLLTQGRAHVLQGSALEEDLRKTRWDQDARAKGLYRWSSHWHPDVADAARYGLASYFDMFTAPDSRTDAEKVRDEMHADLTKFFPKGDREEPSPNDAIRSVLGYSEPDE